MGARSNFPHVLIVTEDGDTDWVEGKAGKSKIVHVNLDELQDPFVFSDQVKEAITEVSGLADTVPWKRGILARLKELRDHKKLTLA